MEPAGRWLGPRIGRPVLDVLTELHRHKLEPVGLLAGVAADDADLYLDALADLGIVVEEVSRGADAAVELDDGEAQVALHVVKRKGVDVGVGRDLPLTGDLKRSNSVFPQAGQTQCAG